MGRYAILKCSNYTRFLLKYTSTFCMYFLHGNIYLPLTCLTSKKLLVISLNMIIASQSGYHALALGKYSNNIIEDKNNTIIIQLLHRFIYFIQRQKNITIYSALISISVATSRKCICERAIRAIPLVTNLVGNRKIAFF